MKKVLILGGYGNFGAHVTRGLAAEKDVRVVIAGRNQDKCQKLAAELQPTAPNLPLYHALDVHRDLPGVLGHVKPDVVVHASGPFQGQGYHVAEACINAGCHYVDLADGREFVGNIARLDAAAKAKGVTVISGASSVPCLTSALVDFHLPQFQSLVTLDYGITTAQKSSIGIATTAAVLSYAGKPFTTLKDGKMQQVYGWQDTKMHNYPELGLRLMGNCDVPDLDLFPQRYRSLQNIHFHAGQEMKLLHLGIRLGAWLVRKGIIKNLGAHAPRLMKVARLFDVFGSDRSGLHMTLKGTGADGKPRTTNFYLIAKSGHGAIIPAIPAILSARMLARGELAQRGAFPCLGVITLPQYMDALKSYDIHTMEETAPT